MLRNNSSKKEKKKTHKKKTVWTSQMSNLHKYSQRSTCASLSCQTLKAHSDHSVAAAPAWSFGPFSNLLEGGSSSCKWWFKVPIPLSTKPWEHASTACGCVTSCRGPDCNWCQSDNRFWINQSIMPTADCIFYYFIRWQPWPLIHCVSKPEEEVFFVFFLHVVISEPSMIMSWNLGSKSQKTKNSTND